LAKIRVLARADIGPGEIRTCFIDRRRVALVCTDEDELYALADYCPHQQAPLAGGRLDYMTDAADVGAYRLTAKQVLRCPWHGYEFDLETGCSLADPRRMRVKTYPVTVEDGEVYVERSAVPTGGSATGAES
jgi:nitrite reductase/ring-hydroxylating ferredoxin subunit